RAAAAVRDSCRPLRPPTRSHPHPRGTFTAHATPYTIGLSTAGSIDRKRSPMPSLQASASCTWSGVLPAVTTQFDVDLRIDLTATRAVQSALVEDGVHGLVVLGTCGENNSLTAEEKRSFLRSAVEAAGGRDPFPTRRSRCGRGAASTPARAPAR